MAIPSFSLERQIAALRPELAGALDPVVDSGQFILGPAVARFEALMAEYLGVSHAIGVGSGSDALYLALLALGVGPGDEVITTPFTFFATAGSIARTGAKPVFTDINPDTFNLDTGKALASVTPRTRAVLPVHLFGDMADIEALALSGLPVVEDAAQAVGAARGEVPAGSAGTVAAFSFFPTKNLGAFGDGGLVSTSDAGVAERVAALRVHGAGRKKYHHDMLGINSRLDALQAAVLAVKLPHLDTWTARRQAIAARYTAGLAELGGEVVLPTVPPGNRHVFHQFTIRAKRRDALQAHLKSQGIGSTVYYPVPLHLQPVFQDLGYRTGDLPEAERAAAEVLSLPMFPELRDEEVDAVIRAVFAFYRGGP